ncbi:MAG: DUF885 domain-containing protein [Pseudomonadota bacterium]
MKFGKLLVLCQALTLASPVLAAVAVRDEAASALHALFDSRWDADMRDNPVRASLLGDRRFNRAWQDISSQAEAGRLESDLATLQALREVDREQLTETDQLNYDLFERVMRDRIEARQFEMHLMPISQRGGIQTLDETGNRLRMTTLADYEDWLARLAQVGQQVDATIALMTEGIAKGVVPPRITMERVPDQIKRQLVETAEDSLFFQPFMDIPAAIAAEDAERLRADARRIITRTLVPAYQRLHDFFTRTYLPASRDTVAASDLPNGRAWYEHRVRLFTTTSMTPDEVHQLGLREVAENRRQMLAVMEEVGFDGDLQAFFRFLREDPRFFYRTPDELFEGYLAVSKRIDPELVRLFGKLPRMPYGLKPIPEAIAPDTTTAYYMRPAADGSRPGYYYVNLYKPETRPKWEMEVLSVHEAVPGHHLQIALQQELEAMPNFRRYGGFTAFTEGWGLYSERLGFELGLYKDPYSRFGQLTYDMWRAVRLVVDTGMHYKGWTRQQAIDYFLENAPKTELDIINEIDRYISNPGQALAYKLGQLKLIEMRARARRALGDRFDVRTYHDMVLSNGAVPLDVLERMVDNWIRSQQP